MPIHDWTKVSPNVFHDFHSAWLSEIRHALNRGVLPSDHFAALEQYSGDIVSNILTLRTGLDESELYGEDSGSGASGGIAVAEAPPKADFELEADAFIPRQKQLAIRHNEGELVALVELVSPANKRTLKARNQFRDKVLLAIEQELHVLVIDILSPGPHDPQGMHGVIWKECSEIPYVAPTGRPLGLASYRAGEVPKAYVRQIAIGSELPAMPIFLRYDRYVEAPLAATYDEAWNGSPRPWREMLTA